MSKDLNKVQFTGRLGADPEVSYTPTTGNLLVKFSVASNRTWVNADGEKQESVEWFTCVVWGKLTEICAEYLRKGSRIYGDGRLQTSSWTDTTTGQKKYKTEVVLNDMIMLDNRQDAGRTQPDADAGDDDVAPEEEAPAPTRFSRTAAAPEKAPTQAERQAQHETQPGRQTQPTRPAAPAQRTAATTSINQSRRGRPQVDEDDDLLF